MIQFVVFQTKVVIMESGWMLITFLVILIAAFIISAALGEYLESTFLKGTGWVFCVFAVGVAFFTFIYISRNLGFNLFPQLF
jgi:hypothetical protein